MSGDLTWTEIAVQLTGEVPVSCRMSESGGLKVTLAGGKKQDFTAKQVDDAIEDLDEIEKSQEGANQKLEKLQTESGPATAAENKTPAAAESKPAAAAKPKPAAGSKPKPKSKGEKAKK